MSRLLILFISLNIGFGAFAQPELNKKMQKQKAEFQALIASEKQYEELIANAELAFQRDQYAAARAFYHEAVQYNPEKEQWLISKINDLDILMAERLVQMVDSVPRVNVKIDTVNSDLTSRRAGLIRKVAYDTLADSASSMVIVSDKELEPEKRNQPLDKAEIKKEVLSVNNALVYPEVIKNKPEIKSYEDYPFGLSEEFIDMGNHTIQRIVVVDSLETFVYKRVKHSWGGDFTFKNDLSISQRIWLVETEAFRIKYPKKEE